MKFAKTVDELKEYQAIQESLGTDLFDIPGVHKVNAHLKGDEVEIQLSNANIVWVPLSDFKDVASDEYNVDPRFLGALGKLYQAIVLARYGAGLAEKIKCIKSSEGYQLFDISKGGFFDELHTYLGNLGVCVDDVNKIIVGLPKLYDTNAIDGITPEGIAIFTEYLNVTLEYIAAKTYIYLEFIGKDDIVIKRVPLGNIDKVMEGEAIETGQDGKDMDQLSYDTFADYQKGLETIARVAARGISLSGGVPLPTMDYATGRPANATSTYVSVPVKDSDLQVVSILAPVELKRVTGSAGTYVFNIESEDGFIDSEFENLRNEGEIAAGLKKLM